MSQSEGNITPIMVGSRALHGQPSRRPKDHEWSKKLSTAPKDWDLVMTIDDTTTWILSNSDGLVDVEFVLPNTLDSYKMPKKIICRYKNGLKVEIEIMDYFMSSWTKLPRSYTQPARMIDEKLELDLPGLAVPAWDVLLFLKFSHFFLPVHWHKNARASAEMLKIMNLDRSSLNIEAQSSTWSDKNAAQEFVNARMFENFAVFYLLRPYKHQRPLIPTMSRDRLIQVRNHIKAAGLAISSPLLRPPASTSTDGFTEYCTGLTFSRASWEQASLSDRLTALGELIPLIATHLYLLDPSNRLFSLFYSQKHECKTKEAFASYIWLLSLESLSTTFLAIPTDSNATHIPTSFFTNTIGVYHCVRTDFKPTKDDDYEEFLIPPHAKPFVDALPSLWIDNSDMEDEKLQSLFKTEARARNSPITRALFLGLPELLLDVTSISKSFVSLVQPLFDRLNAHEPPEAPILPVDVLRILTGHMDDHITLTSFYSTNKVLHAFGNRDEVWEPFAKRVFFGLCEPPAHGHSWKSAFKQFYVTWRAHTFSGTVACPTCGGRHEKRSDPPRKPYDPEAYDEHEWGWCACPKCDAGSWGTCNLRERFLWKKR